jgi:protein phosphatase
MVYLPPTMSPCETERSGPYLEHPNGAFEYFRKYGIKSLVCQEKHMGSRAVIVICKDNETARRRFGITSQTEIGECFTRTGRRFFDEPVRTQLLTKLQTAMTNCNFWETHNTDWAVIDSEILPWNTKARGLLKEQYAPVGAAAFKSISSLNDSLAKAKARGLEISDFNIPERKENIQKYINAYEAYCWSVYGIEGIEIAPFHLLATEKAVHTDKDHRWHIESLSSICDSDPTLLRKTDHIFVDIDNDDSVQTVIDWWTERTNASAEGMVVKPLEFISKSSDGLLQPAVKCRGREYLRIIYGPEYTLENNIDELRHRGLGRKRSLALREFALGVESLGRFVNNAPLHKVHECVFAVLALESEPVDPRL